MPRRTDIENLELVQPSMVTAPLYARIGIWVYNALGTESTIRNCKITIAAKETDPGHANNRSVGIWFHLGAGQVPTPRNGARIDVVSNTVGAAGVHEAIHVDSFWPEMPAFTPPRAFVNGNTVVVSKLGGCANKLGTNGATLAAAMVLAGSISHSIVTNNTMPGDGRSPGLRLGLRLGSCEVHPVQAYRGLAVMVGELFDRPQVVADCTIGVITALEFLSASFCLIGSQGPPCDPTLPPVEASRLPSTRRVASAAPAA
jgi:hypothetical protein